MPERIAFSGGPTIHHVSAAPALDEPIGSLALRSGSAPGLYFKLSAGTSGWTSSLAPGEALNVKSRGAAGDNSTDDTVVIQAAIQAAATAGGGEVFFPPGTYITQPLTLLPGVVLRGVNGQAYYNATSTVPNVNNLTRLKLKAGSSSALISPDDTGTNSATACKILDLCLDCNGINQPAINLPDVLASISRFWTIEGTYVVNVNAANAASGYAVYIGNLNTAVTMRDCVLFNGTSGSAAGYNGLGWYGSDGRADNVYIGYFANTGLTPLGGATDQTLAWRGGGIFTCNIAVAVGGGGVVFSDTSFDHCQADGVYVNNSPVTFVNCTFHTNSMVGNGSNSNVKVAGNNATVTLVGCRAAPRGEGSNDPKYMVEVTGTGCTVNLFGNINEGVSFTTGWTNAAGPGTTYNTALGADTALTADNALHTLVTSPSLPIGTYLVTATFSVEATSGTSEFCDWGVTTGSATATLVGCTAGVTSEPSSASQFICSTNTLTFIATVTVAGTLILQYQTNGGLSALKTGVLHNLGQSTGITAVAITKAV